MTGSGRRETGDGRGRARLLLSGVLVITGMAVWACSKDSTGPDLSGLPACGAATRFTVSPLQLPDIREIAPLGNLAPPGHTFPTDHMYFYPLIGPGVPIASPGQIRVTQVTLQKRTGNGQPEFDDYGLDFYPCPSEHFYFAHVSAIDPSLLAAFGSLGSGCGAPYETGGYTFQQCRKTVKVDVAPGAPVGTAGGPNQGALDLGGNDDAAPPLAYIDAARQTGSAGTHAVCPLDYFTADVGDSLRARLAVNGNQRTAPPVCGTIAQDVAGTAQGRWFFDATGQEDHHLALVHQNWDPAIGAFSIGTQVPGTSPTVLQFAPVGTGRLNRDFSGVSADGKLYCYEPNNATGHVFIQLPSATQLKIEVTSSGACGDSTTWAFGAGVATFAR